jgi:hypothetical protein
LLEQEDLVFPAVKNSEEVVAYLYKSTLPSLLDPVVVYDSVKVISVNHYLINIICIRYQLFTDTLESYAYVNLMGEPGKKTHTVVLHVPGSGDNRPGRVASRSIPEEDPTLQASQIGADIYFPVFPADDILAIHDGTKMLDIKKIIPYLSSLRRNLSIRYMANIFALKKYLDTQYKSMQVWGHSRGGLTATIMASFFLPDTVIISSGYSVKSNRFFRMGLDQFWWQGASTIYDPSYMKSRFCHSKSKVYFLFGKKEVDDMYGLETKYNYTEKYFSDCPNVKVGYTNHKHVWFTDEISKILGK